MIMNGSYSLLNISIIYTGTEIVAGNRILINCYQYTHSLCTNIIYNEMKWSIENYKWSLSITSLSTIPIFTRKYIKRNLLGIDVLQCALPISSNARRRYLKSSTKKGKLKVNAINVYWNEEIRRQCVISRQR